MSRGFPISSGVEEALDAAGPALEPSEWLLARELGHRRCRGRAAAKSWGKILGTVLEIVVHRDDTRSPREASSPQSVAACCPKFRISRMAADPLGFAPRPAAPRVSQVSRIGGAVVHEDRAPSRKSIRVLEDVVRRALASPSMLAHRVEARHDDRAEQVLRLRRAPGSRPHPERVVESASPSASATTVSTSARSASRARAAARSCARRCRTPWGKSSGARSPAARGRSSRACTAR